ncbi:MAG TPA: hypothetical protein VMO26_18225 [Vicinamibacterales bacterium]|nr:hypothetical protein [Vicinamibacterales bacterium]
MLTFVLAVIGGLQVWAAFATNTHTRAIERAYISLLPDPPGIRIDGRVIPKDGVAHLDVAIYIRLKNVGNTPAVITYALMHLLISNEPLPKFPPYDGGNLRRMWVTVVRDQNLTIFHNYSFEVAGIEDLKTSDSLKLYALGYVDYIDKFGVRHRSGYARVYNPSLDDFSHWAEDTDPATAAKAWAERLNLVFVTEPNYSYDRERKKGEGEDWNEPSQQRA